MATPRKPKCIHSLGTFQEHKARRIAADMTRSGFAADVSQLSTDNGPTTWWHVNVKMRDANTAAGYLAGWLAGEHYGRIDMRSALHGRTFEETEIALGYVLAPAKTEVK